MKIDKYSLHKEELKILVKPIQVFLKNEYHPHCKIILDSTDFELLEGLIVNTDLPQQGWNYEHDIPECQGDYLCALENCGELVYEVCSFEEGRKKESASQWYLPAFHRLKAWKPIEKI